MLKFSFDPHRPHRVVIYARMSSEKQNRRSPDQQIADIKRRLKSLGYRWVIGKVYRDDAKPGVHLRRRPGYQQMLADIRTGAVAADAILVDNIERFARLKELPVIRKELFEHYGTLVLAADENFCDPTTPQGEALGMLETWRAHDSNRVKALEVVRGKRDAAQRKFWPGGDAPFGYLLHKVVTARGGKEEVEGSVLRPCPETGWIITLLFRRALETGHGQGRLTRFLNGHPDIPNRYKPVLPSAVGYRLQHEIYKGVLVWGKSCTGVIDDVRVVRDNPQEEVLVVADFCAPLTTPETWDAVNALRQTRADRIAAARRLAAPDDGKEIAAPAPGLALKYLTSGLLRCHTCGRAMTASSSRAYVAKAGDARRYVHYVCPAAVAGLCPNQTRVPEQWIRGVVVDTIRRRLFPPPA